MSASTAAPRRRASSGLPSALGLSGSQAALRGLLVLASFALVGLTLVAAPHALVVAAVALVPLTVWAAWRPESPWATVLVAGLVLHWVATVPVPSAAAGWLRLLAAALLLLVVHLALSLAASLPPGAPLPAATVRRWTRRGAVVAGATVPVWAVAFLAGRQRVAGEVGLTYAAIAAAAVLTLAVHLLSRDDRDA
jgi:hypothetical protein